MRRVKLLGLATLTLLAFGAYATTGAYAVEKEEENNPRILCLTGVNCNQLKSSGGSAAGTKPALVTLKHEVAAEKATVSVENCETITGNAADINLCKDVKADVTGIKEGSNNCRSENAKGEKDPIETVLALLDIHTAAGTNAAGTLVPIATAQLLGTALEAEVKFVCGVLKIKVVGTLACEFGPGLTVVSVSLTLSTSCKVNATTKDPEPAKCTILCEDLGKVGVTATFGETPEDAWVSFIGECKPSLDVFIDD